ncbi:MAG: hypothetical protein KDN22_30000 [Verrucomicrobiae bacterium]|nr:hypothetical protein [Verrucomicrobiae bacterium]
MIVPTGIITDDTYKKFFSSLVKTSSLAAAYDCENMLPLFPEVKRTMRFCMLTFEQNPIEPLTARFAFFIHQVSDLTDTSRVFTLSDSDIGALNPNTKTCPVFRRSTDAELTKAAYRWNPVLEVVDGNAKSNPWNVRLTTLYHTSSASSEFRTFSELEEKTSLVGNFLLGDEGDYAPLYEQNLISFYDHRFATYRTPSGAISPDTSQHVNASRHSVCSELSVPRFWVSTASLQEVWTKKAIQNGWVIGFRKTGRSVDSRTGIFAIIPKAAIADSIQVAHFPIGDAAGACCRQAEWCSFAWDYLFRQSVSGENTSFYIIRQVACITPNRHRLANSPLQQGETIAHVLELSFTAWDLEPLAQDCGYDGPPFRWDEERRFQLRCELDALFFHLYLPCDDAGDWKPARIADGAVRDETDEELATLKSHFPTPRDAVAYIMETFPIVKNNDIARTEQKDAEGNITHEGTYLTKDRILEIYDQMLQARRNGEPWQSPLDPHPGPPTDAEGNFIPMSDWGDHYPPHIHAPKDGSLPAGAMRHFTDLARGDIPETPVPIHLPEEIAEKIGGNAWLLTPLADSDPIPGPETWVIVAHPELRRRDDPCGGVAAGKLRHSQQTDAETGESFVHVTLRGPVPPAELRLSHEEWESFRPVGILSPR